jgi:hypothetical protein
VGSKSRKKTEPELYYKVLLNGASCNGGNIQYSLPVEIGEEKWAPGQWHELRGPLSRPDNALHATKDPAYWWQDGAECFFIEFEGHTENDFYNTGCGQKIWGLKARLVRKCTKEELEKVQVFFNGEHTVNSGAVSANGNSTVSANGNSTVSANENSTVRAYGNSTVSADGNSRVSANGNSTVRAYGDSTVCANENSTVNIYKTWWTKDPTVFVSGDAVLIDRGKGRPQVTGSFDVV